MRLKNSTKSLLVFTLPHDEVCGGECFCTDKEHLQTALDGRTGKVGIRQMAVRVPASLYIPAGTITEEIPEEFLNARVVRAALTNGLRKV